MANDVHEQVFSEKQLFSEDVRGEDDDSHNFALTLDSPSASSSAVKLSPAESKRAARERKRQRAAEKAQSIVFYLESKYDILLDVCSGKDNWKEAASGSVDFDLFWCDTAICADRFMKLKNYQKMNHFVGMSSITRKNNLGRNLLRMRKQFPKEFKFFPDTWILPTDLSDFKMQFSQAKNKTFIIKPDNGCQGKGIFLVRDVEKVPVDFSTTYVAQRYIQRPLLLDGFKFDLRLYVLVLGCDPLRIFLHKRGLVRLASEAYVEPNSKNIQQSMVHLTNYAINKMNPNFEENTNPENAQDGHKRSWEAVKEFLRKSDHDVDTLTAEIEDLIIKTLISVQPSLSHFYRSCQPEDLENAMCFEILGFDVMLDAKLQPWLLEVNHAPSFAAESELDRVVKTEVLQDSLHLLHMSPAARKQKKRETKEKMDMRATGTLKKQTLEERAALEQEIAIARTVWEDANLGNYKRLYPSEEQERHYLPIHDAALNIWEMLMGGTSRRSVRLTQTHEEEDDESAVTERSNPAKAPKSSLGASASEQPPKEVPKRTAEHIREAADRLMNGISTVPRSSPSGNRRRSSKGGTLDNATIDPDGGKLGMEDASWNGTPGKAFDPITWVSVGDSIKVQTNLGWENVMVRAKRGNGKIDIQFKDGEYMRSVLPRIHLPDHLQPSAAEQSQSVRSTGSNESPERPSGRADGPGDAIGSQAEQLLPDAIVVSSTHDHLAENGPVQVPGQPSMDHRGTLSPLPQRPLPHLKQNSLPEAPTFRGSSASSAGFPSSVARDGTLRSSRLPAASAQVAPASSIARESNSPSRSQAQNLANVRGMTRQVHRAPDIHRM